MKIIKKFAAKVADNCNAPGVTMAFLGDSVTQGCFEMFPRTDKGFVNCHDRQHTYHTYLQQILSILYPNVPVNIINAGVAGKNAINGLDRLERDVLAYSPDLTVVCFGLNDCGAAENGISQYTEALNEIFDRLENAGSEIIFMTPNMMATHISPLLSEASLRNIAELFAGRQNSGILDQYLNSAKELCHSRGIPVCDCYEKWKLLQASGVDITELLANKINHPTRQMHWMFAYELVKTILEEKD